METKLDNPKIGVVGLGKLGLPLALVLHSGGFEVVGFDLNSYRISELRNRVYRGPEPLVSEMLLNSSSDLQFTDKIESIRDCSIVYIIVPTPSDDNGVFTSTYVEDAIAQIQKCWIDSQEDKIIVIVSTLMPGTTKNIQHKYGILNHKNSIHLIYSPEFIALGSVIQNLYYPDSILIGSESDYATKTHLLICNRYLRNSPQVQVLNPTEAELAKIMVNAFVTMKISFANFIGEIATKMEGINAKAVANAVGTDTRIGNKYLKPGLGYGGPCFPRDNKALIAYSKSNNLEANLALATDIINIRQPDFFFDRIRKEIGHKQRIGILGLSYKENSEVYEQSQGIMLANKLQNESYEIICFDNFISERPTTLNSKIRFTNQLLDLTECDLLLELIESSENIVIGNWNIPILKP